MEPAPRPVDKFSAIWEGDRGLYRNTDYFKENLSIPHLYRKVFTFCWRLYANYSIDAGLIWAHWRSLWENFNKLSHKIRSKCFTLYMCSLYCCSVLGKGYLTLSSSVFTFTLCRDFKQIYSGGSYSESPLGTWTQFAGLPDLWSAERRGVHRKRPQDKNKVCEYPVRTCHGVMLHYREIPSQSQKSNLERLA